MGKTVMRPRMKRGISIAAAVACSFTLIPAVNAVQGGEATANAVVDRPLDSRVSKVAGAIEKGTSIFDNPETLKKLQEMDKAAIEPGSGSYNANTSPTHSALLKLYKENGVEIPSNSNSGAFSNNWEKGYTLLAAHLDATSETLGEEDGLGGGSDHMNSNGSFTDETSVGQPVVYVRHAGQKEFIPASASSYFNGIKTRNGSGSHSDVTDREHYSEAYVDYRFVAPKDFNGEVILSIPSGGSASANDRLTERLFVVTSDSNPYKPAVTDNNSDVTPKGKDLTTNVGKKPAAKDGIANSDKFPGDTKYEWTKEPDVSQPGKPKGTIKVTEPNGKETEVEVTVTVTDPNANANTGQKDADKYDPKPKEITVPRGKEPKAEDGIANKDKLPEDSKYTWKTTPKTDKPGDTTGTVVVTYPDGSKDEVEVPIKVTSDADKYAPKPQDVATRVGVTPPASDGIANTNKLPKGTKYEWQKQPDVSKPGETTGTVKVTYPDGTSETVDVRVMVTQDIYVSDISKQSNGDYKVTRNDGKTWTIDLHSLNDRISKNEKRIDNLEKGVKANKGNIAKNKDAIDALRKETGELKKQVEGLKKSAQDADKRLDELEKQAKDQGKTLDTLVKENKAADDAIKNLTKQVTDLKKQQDVLKTRVSKLETRVTKLEADVKGLKDNAHAWAQCFSGIGTSAIPVLLALPLGLAAQADVPGIGNVNAEVQKKLGIFNPAAAKWVSENRGIMQMAAGVMGFAGILGAMVHAAQDCGPYVKDDYVKDTELGQLSSKMDSIKDDNAEGSSVEGGSSLGDNATEGGSSLGNGEGSSLGEGSSEE